MVDIASLKKELEEARNEKAALFHAIAGNERKLIAYASVLADYERTIGRLRAQIEAAEAQQKKL